jgi:iron complex outermembrane recepter protein
VTPAVILADLTKYGALVTRGPVDPAFPNLPGPITSISQTNLNLGETRLSGIDLDTRIGVPAGEIGKFTFGLTGTYFIKYDTQNLDGTFSGGVNQVNTTTGGVIPRWKHYLSVLLERGPWNFLVAQNWQSGYWDLPGTFEDPSDPAFHQRRVGAYETYDFQLGYTGIKDMRLKFGIKNIFNRNPPYTNAGGQTSFQAGYDPQYADPRGRFVYVGVAYQFK